MHDTPPILLTGEIFVRHDDLSRQFLAEKLAEQGFATKVSGVMEWVYYTDWCFKKGLSAAVPSLRERVSLLLRSTWMRRYEESFKKSMERSNFPQYRLDDVEHLISNISQLLRTALELLSPQMKNDGIL